MRNGGDARARVGSYSLRRILLPVSSSTQPSNVIVSNKYRHHHIICSLKGLYVPYNEKTRTFNKCYNMNKIRAATSAASPYYETHRLFSNYKNNNDSNDGNKSAFHTNKALQRARLKGELRPMLSLAIHSYLTKKLSQTRTKRRKYSLEDDATTRKTDTSTDFEYSMKLLAQWNDYQQLAPSRIVVTHFDSGRIPMGQGLIAEASPFAAENYIVFARPRPQNKKQQHHQQPEYPPFVEEDASWYRAIESKVNDNLDRWEENARIRRKKRLATAKQGLQRLLDMIQAPLSKLFGAMTDRIGPVVDRARTTVRDLFRGPSLQKDESLTSDSSSSNVSKSPSQVDEVHSDSTSSSSTTRMANITSTTDIWNKTEPEDLIVITKDNQTLMLLNDVYPQHRLLALPLVDAIPSGIRRSKVKPPYRLRLARGGLVITYSIIIIGAIAPTYRSLRFILEYPRTAEIVMITLVGSVAYNLWSWRAQARTRQQELISTAIQSRLVARNEAAISFLTDGATERLTEILMDDYVCRLLYSDDEQSYNSDPFVMEIGLYLGLFRGEKPPENDLKLHRTKRSTEGAIIAVKWEDARAELVHKLAARM